MSINMWHSVLMLWFSTCVFLFLTLVGGFLNFLIYSAYSVAFWAVLSSLESLWLLSGIGQHCCSILLEVALVNLMLCHRALHLLLNYAAQAVVFCIRLFWLFLLHFHCFSEWEWLETEFCIIPESVYWGCVLMDNASEVLQQFLHLGRDISVFVLVNFVVYLTAILVSVQNWML